MHKECTKTHFQSTFFERSCRKRIAPNCKLYLPTHHVKTGGRCADFFLRTSGLQRKQPRVLQYSASFVVVQIVGQVLVSEHAIQPRDDIFGLPCGEIVRKVPLRDL
jgi:hypothetical protein